MPNSDMSGSDSDRAAYTAVSPDREARAGDRVGAREKEERSGRRFSTSRVIGSSERDRMLEEARNIQFPIGLRGYERTAVDRYVERVNRLLAELEMSSSPESAVRHALDEVSEETRDILQHAHETADEITARSRAKADDRLQQAESEAQGVRAEAQRDASETREAAQREAHELRELATGEVQNLRDIAQREAQEFRETAKRESAELRETSASEMAELRDTATRETQQLRASAQREAEELRDSARREADEMLESAETQTRELARSAEAIWRERRRLIEDMRTVGEQLVAIGEVEGKRFPRLAEEAQLHAELGREQASTEATPRAPEPESVTLPGPTPTQAGPATTQLEPNL